MPNDRYTPNPPPPPPMALSTFTSLQETLKPLLETCETYSRCVCDFSGVERGRSSFPLFLSSGFSLSLSHSHLSPSLSLPYPTSLSFAFSPLPCPPFPPSFDSLLLPLWEGGSYFSSPSFSLLLRAALGRSVTLGPDQYQSSALIRA